MYQYLLINLRFKVCKVFHDMENCSGFNSCLLVDFLFAFTFSLVEYCSEQDFE